MCSFSLIVMRRYVEDHRLAFTEEGSHMGGAVFVK